MSLIKDIIMPNTPCLGLFTVKDFIRLSGTNTYLQRVIVKGKVIKRLVRFGNLDSSLRLAFWSKLCPYTAL